MLELVFVCFGVGIGIGTVVGIGQKMQEGSTAKGTHCKEALSDKWTCLGLGSGLRLGVWGGVGIGKGLLIGIGCIDETHLLAGSWQLAFAIIVTEAPNEVRLHEFPKFFVDLGVDIEPCKNVRLAQTQEYLIPIPDSNT